MTSLHTKYRPKTFDEIVGHTTIIKSLKQVIKDKRAHTFLFAGPAGTGKTTLARILANAFAGEQATVANIEEVAAADNTGVDDMRKIIHTTNFRAMGESPIKAIILDEAHRLSANAWDVLLKPIEEPPAHIYWMICSTNPGKIPQTILTRCLRYDLKPVAEDDLLELLIRVVEAEKLEVADEIIEVVVEEANGSPRQSLVYLEACAYAENSSQARSIMRSAAKSKETIDFCQWLMGGRGRTWAEGVKLIKAMGEIDAESVRIQTANYLAVVAMGSKNNDKAAQALFLLSCFSGKTYNASDKQAPLLLSMGMALGLDK